MVKNDQNPLRGMGVLPPNIPAALIILNGTALIIKPIAADMSTDRSLVTVGTCEMQSQTTVNHSKHTLINGHSQKVTVYIMNF